MSAKVSDFTDVFISYRRKDVEFVKHLAERLKQEGKQVWIDWEDIPPGSVDFADDIRRGLEGADAFIAVLSPDYLESTYCVDLELAYAIELRKKVIPIVLRKFDDYEIPNGIGHINWVYFTPHAGQVNTFEDAFPKVMVALDADLDHVRRHKRLLMRALEWDNNEREGSYLLTGDEISQAEAWLNTAVAKDPSPTALHAEYIGASRAQATRRQRRTLAGVSVALAVSVVLTVLAVFLGIAADRARGEAEFNYILAVTNEAEAVANANLAATNEAQAVAARATAVSRAEQSDARLLSQQLPFIVDRDPVLAYSIGDDLLQLENLPSAARETVGSTLYNIGAARVIDSANGPLSDVTFSPDGERLFGISCMYGEDGFCVSPELFAADVSTGERVWQANEHTDEINRVDVSMDGRYVATSSADGSTILWDAATGDTLRELYHDGAFVISVAFSPDSTLLATGDDYGGLWLWDVETGEVIWQAEEHTDWVTGIAFTPDGARLISVSDDLSLGAWDVVTGELLEQRVGHEDALSAVDVSPNGRWIATSGLDNLVLLWNADTYEIVAEIDWHFDWVNGVAFTPDGDRLITASDDGSVAMWSVDAVLNGETDWPLASFTGHTSWINAVSASPAGGYAASASDDGTVIVWDIDTVPLLARSEAGDIFEAYDGALLPDEERLLVAGCTGYDACRNAHLSEWDTASMTQLRTFEGEGLADSDALLSVAVSPDGTQAVSGDYDGNLILWDIASGTQIDTLSGHRDWVNTVAFSPDGQQVISGSYDSTAVVWDLATGEAIHTLRHNDGVIDLAYSADGSQIFTASCVTTDPETLRCIDGSVLIWDATSGERLGVLAGHRGRALSLALLPDGKHLLSGGDDRSMVLWDIEQREPLRTFFGHEDIVESVQVSADGQLALSGASTEMLVWDLDSGERVRTFDDHDDAVNDVMFVPSLSAAVSVSYDGELSLWRMIPDTTTLREWAAANRQQRDISCDERELYRTPRRCTDSTE